MGSSSHVRFWLQAIPVASDGRSADANVSYLRVSLLCSSNSGFFAEARPLNVSLACTPCYTSTVLDFFGSSLSKNRIFWLNFVYTFPLADGVVDHMCKLMIDEKGSDCLVSGSVHVVGRLVSGSVREPAVRPDFMSTIRFPAGLSLFMN